MSSDKALIDSFIGIVGNEATEEEAIKFLKMGKNNLEAALNYYFNKKVKNDKPITPPPSNAFQKLQQGSKKQAHVEKIIKDLRHDFSSKEIQPSNIDLGKAPDTLKVSKYPNPNLNRQSSSFSAGLNTSIVSDSSATKSQPPKINDSYTPMRDFDIRSQLSAAKISDAMEEEKAEVKEENKLPNVENNPLFPSNDEKGVSDNEGSQLRRSSRARKPPTPIYSHSPFRNEKSPMREASPARSDRSDRSEESGKKPKNLKRNFDQYEDMHIKEDMQPIIESNEEETKMIVEESIQDLGWPKFLGRFVAKAHIMSSFHRDMEEGII